MGLARLGRLVVPGPNPMSIPMTALVGIGGSIIGGVIGNLVFHRRAGGLILSVLGAMLIVWLVSRNQHRTAA